MGFICQKRVCRIHRVRVQVEYFSSFLSVTNWLINAKQIASLAPDETPRAYIYVKIYDLGCSFFQATIWLVIVEHYVAD